ncbi:ATP-binding cassette domain-containing protein [uncultured Clostridium sp.]|uniref:ATP-binding cassette domain-containing protein n=1 Tax=uncultured Clostridium sp. TaxID=59620 RepID=UPI002591F1E9|nr:ATP-binding cassette domain-containing protein [uncultured Clostridium sp.]
MFIEIKGFTKELNGKMVLNNINLKIIGGKIYGLIGENGSGKSILLKSICGLVNIKQGEIIVNGKILGKDIDFPDNIGALLDGSGFIPYLSGFKNLELLAAIKNNISSEKIKQCMELVGLDSADKTSYKNYSLGMKQKLGIVQAIMEDPQILILDEPFNGIDRKSVSKIKEIILEYKKNGAIILITSHIEEDIKSICDEVFEIKNNTLQTV